MKRRKATNKMKKNFALTAVIFLFSVVLPMQSYSATSFVSETNTLSSHKLAMSIAFLRERVLKNNPGISDERCLHEIHSMLDTLGFDVSFDEVKKIGRAERKVSNAISEIQIKELKPLRLHKSSRPLKLVADSAFVASTIRELSDSATHSRDQSLKESRDKSLKLTGRNEGPLRKRSDSLKNKCSLQDVVTFLLLKAEKQLSLMGRNKVCSRNYLVLNSLYSLGLPEVNLGLNWERYKAPEFLNSIRQNVSKASIEEFEENAAVFINSL
jgi:hypothetical protein